MEMSQDNIDNCLVETKTKLTDDLFRLLQVREKNESMSKDWLLFLTSTPKFSKLTPGEIYQAFKMALSRELRDSKNEEINLLPELSINSTGKVLTAYLEWKRNFDSYQLAKEKLRMLRNQSGPTADEVAEIRNEFLQTVFDEIQDLKFSGSAWLLFQDIESKLKTSNAVKKRLYRMQDKKYLKELALDVKEQGKRPHHVELLETAQKNSSKGKLNVIVQNRCRAIVVCNYLKRFKTFGEFKNEIDGVE